MSRVEVLSWDYNEQPDLGRLAELVADMSGGRVHLTSVEDTGDQDYALIVAARPFEQPAASAVYRYWYENGKVDAAEVSDPSGRVAP